MDDDNVLDFEAALDASEVTDGGRHVLLGNGFSIAWRPDKFSYTSLYQEARIADIVPTKEDLFGTLGTYDFERVMEHLSTASQIVALYGAGEPLRQRMEDDAKTVRRALADVISEIHPDQRNLLTDDECEHAREFFANFNSVFTLNYDLLLYWVLLRDNSAYKLDFKDGFQWPTYEVRDDLVWKIHVAEAEQNVFYLHGALHYFAEEGWVHKLHYGRDPLVAQVSDRILRGDYPLFVSEGTSVEKAARIEASEYLRFCRNSLSHLQGTLFIHGASLGDNDDHIWHVLESRDSKLEALWVSVHGAPEDEPAQQVMQRARLIATRRRSNGGRALRVGFYGADSVSLWGS